jgi:hypothetical protein
MLLSQMSHVNRVVAALTWTELLEGLFCSRAHSYRFFVFSVPLKNYRIGYLRCEVHRILATNGIVENLEALPHLR